MLYGLKLHTDNINFTGQIKRDYINQVSYNTINIIPLVPFNIIDMFKAKNNL